MVGLVILSRQSRVVYLACIRLPHYTHRGKLHGDTPQPVVCVVSKMQYLFKEVELLFWSDQHMPMVTDLCIVCLF